MLDNGLEYEEFEEEHNDTDDSQETDIEEMGDDIGDIVDLSVLDDDLQIPNKISDIDVADHMVVENNDLEKDSLIRDLLDQNVNEQRLPSDTKVEWSDENEKGNSDCVLRDDAEFVVKFKSSGEQRTFTGAEFKGYLQDKYGRDCVTYSHKEPDFEPFEQCIDKEEFEQFLFDKYGRHIEVLEVPEGHVEVDCMGTDRNDTYGAAYDHFLEIIGDEVSKKDLEEYMQKKKDLTWHECGDRKTIRMVPTEINQVFSHTGGIGIEKDFEALIAGLADVTATDIEDNRHRFSLEKVPMLGKTEGLEEAIDFRHEKFREKKKELF